MHELLDDISELGGDIGGRGLIDGGSVDVDFLDDTHYSDYT